jgi:hypothetical protein
MASIFDLLDEDKEQEGGVDAPVSPVGTGAIASELLEEYEVDPDARIGEKIVDDEEEYLTEDFETVINKDREPERTKLQEMLGAVKGVLQEPRVGAGEIADTMAIYHEIYGNVEQQVKDDFNNVLRSLPFKSRVAFSKRMRDENLSKEQAVPELIKELESGQIKDLGQRLLDFKEEMGESLPLESTGLIRHAEIAARGMAHFFPTMFASAVAQSTGVPGAAPAAAIGVAYMQIFSPKYREYTEAGIDPERSLHAATGSAITQAFVEAGSTVFQVGRLMKMFKTAKPILPMVKAGFIPGFLKNAAAEGIEELTQAHIEVIWDVYAGHPEMDGAEMAGLIWDIYKSPSFQSGAWQEAAYGFAGGGGMFAAGAGVAKLAGTYENKDGSVKPQEGKGAPTKPINVGPGREFKGADTSEDVREQSPGTKRPTVDDLMGVNKAGEDLEIDDLIVEDEEVEPGAKIGEKSSPGRTLSDNLQVTPEQQKQQKDTQVSIEGILEDMEIKQSLKKNKVVLQNNERHLADIEALYGESVILDDHEEALSLAEQFQEVATKQVAAVTEFMSARESDMTKKQLEQTQAERDAAQIYKSELQAKIGNMLNTQVSAIRIKENQEFMDFADELHNKPEVLKESLLQQETLTGNLKTGAAKLYRKLADGMDARRWMGDEQFYGKKIKTDKLLELKGDLERKILKEKDDVKVSGYQKAVDDAAMSFLDETLAGKVEYDRLEAQADRAEELQKELQESHRRLTRSSKEAKAAQAEKTAASERRLQLKRQGRRAAVGTQHEKMTVQRQAERARAYQQEKKREEATELDKKRAIIREQKEKLRKPPIQPVRKERLEELEASKARKAAVKKQIEKVAEAERKPHVLPKKVKTKDLKKPEAEYVIVTPDNPQSTERSPIENKRGQIALAKKLDEQGIDYEIGKSKFDGKPEVPFIIKGMTRDEGKKLSDELNQTSFLHGKSDTIALIEGKSANVVKKKEIKIAPDATDYYTELNGEKFTVPFYTEKSSDIDVAEMQLSGKEVNVAKSKFRSAAVKFKDKVFEGPSHMSIIMQNAELEDFINKATVSEINNQIEQGFAGHDGVFTDRYAASREIGLGKDSYLTSEEFIEPVLQVKADNMAEGIDAVFTVSETKGLLEIITAQTEREAKARPKRTPVERQIKNIEAVLTMPTSEVSSKRKSELKATLKDLKAGITPAQKIAIVDFDKMKLKDKIGTLELADAFKKKMKTSKHAFLFNKTKAGGIQTKFITAPGQYAKLEEVKRSFPNLKHRDDAISEFEGRLQVDPKTGKMKSTGGYKGVYLAPTKAAVINLPTISGAEIDIDKAFETVVHEHVHGLVDLTMDKMPQQEQKAFRKELDNFWESIPETFRNKVRDDKNTHVRVTTGIMQIDRHRPELVTYATAHPEFAEWLDSIPASPRFRAKSSKIKSMWDALVDLIVKRVLKMPSKLDELRDILNTNLRPEERLAGVRFSKEGKARWKEPIRKYREYLKSHPTAATEKVIAGTGLSEYQVKTLDELHAKNVRYSKELSDPVMKTGNEILKRLKGKYLDWLTDTKSNKDVLSAYDYMAQTEEYSKMGDEVAEYVAYNLADAWGRRFAKDVSFAFGANVTHANVSQWAKALDDAAANGIPSTVVETIADAEKLVGFEIGPDVASMWLPEHEMEVYTGKKGKKTTKTIPAQVIIIAENIESDEHLLSKWMHEQVGHQGLRNTFPNNALLLRFLDQSFNMFNIQNKDLLNEIIDLYDIGTVDSKGNRVLTKTEKRLAAEEVIARRSEQLKPAVKTGLVNKFKAFLSRWLPKVFIGKRQMFKLNENDIMNILEMSKANVMTGDTTAGNMLKKKLEARAPKHKFSGWETLPNFMKPDKEYIRWVHEVEKEAPQIRKWYDRHQDTLHKHMGKDADLFNVLLSVTSPQADVNTNVVFACQTYAYLMGLTEKPGALFANKLKEKIDTKWTSPEGMFEDLESTLYKVTEFVRGLNGDPDATVGDMWMYRAFFGDNAVYNKENEAYSVPQTVALRQKLMDLSAKLSAETGETYTPREVQAAIWVHINAKTNGIKFSEVADYQTGFNKPSAKFGGKTPLEWLKNLVPNLSDGPLSEKLSIPKVPMAPISPLAKKRLDQIRKELRARGKKVDKFNIADDGTISVQSTNPDEMTLNLIDAISKGGNRIEVPVEAADWHRETFGFKEVATEAETTVMRLSDDAVAVFTNPKGKITPTQIRDNLGGFSGTYTQTARFAREARKNLDQIAALSTEKADADFLRTGNDGMSVTGKIHEWRDGSKHNWDRYANHLEQEFLEKFGGRKSRVKVLGSDRFLGTPKTELLQKAMNLYIDSGTGQNLQRVMEHVNNLSQLPKLTNRQKMHLLIIDRMMEMSEEETAWANENIRPYYEDIFSFAKEHKLIDTHVDNYVKRSWRMPKEYENAGVTWSGAGTSGFILTPASGKKRTFNSIVDGWELGMDLYTEGVIGNLQNYGTEIGYVFANRRFVKYMRSLITFDADSLMMEGDGNFKPPAGFAKVRDRGFVKPGKVLFARQDFADELNKLGERASRQIWDKPIVKVIRKINSMLKSTILSVSLFHHLAGLRSYGYAVNGKGFKYNGIKAYKRGLAKIDEQTVMDNPTYEHIGPVIDYLVREGLTLGRTQDWDQSAMQDSFIEDMLLKRTTKLSAVALEAWKRARRGKQSLTTGLFGRLFAGLKAEGAAFEFGHNLKLKEKEILKKEGAPRGLTDSEIKLAAQQAATIINADFGGLHLSRMGRSPDIQKVAQLLLLAPDWTESNWRTVTGMIPGANNLINKAIGDRPEIPGMGKVYRRFWKGAAIRILTTVALANAAILVLFADDDEKEDYFDMLSEQFTAKNFIKGKWLSVPIDPMLPESWKHPEKRRLLSVAGHFKDILKMVPTELDPLKNAADLFAAKASPMGKMVESAISREDWKGARFTTAAELLKTGKITMDNQFAKEAEGSTFLSLMFYNLRAGLPIAAGELLQAIAGETTAISALSRAAGIEVRDVRRVPVARQKFEKISSEINELDKNLADARKIKDQRMIFEARKDIRDYDGFNKKKARIGSTKRLIAVQNNRIKDIKVKQKEGIALTDKEEKRLRETNEKKQAIWEKAMKILNR